MTSEKYYAHQGIHISFDVFTLLDFFSKLQKMCDIVMINSKPVPSSAAIVQSPIKATNAKLLGIPMVL